jgi:polysaccharide pyruvyl transferase WcaK-like protein
MKIALMSGAYVNAGDFLIVKRCQELLYNQYPDCQIRTILRKVKLTEKAIKDINSSDVLVLAGGPLYLWNMYPQIMPLTDDLAKIKVPIFAMACGQRLFDCEDHNIFNNSFTPATRRLLDRIALDGFPFGCRDVIAAQLLQSMGYQNVIITGCAAWYNLQENNIGKRKDFSSEIQHICVSDCDALRNSNGVKRLENHAINDMKSIIQLLMHRYPKADLRVVFHRDMTSAHKKLTGWLSNNNIEFHSINGSADGFSIYNSCDLHVGFRVHAHIYNLSLHTRSILISEDARGCGVNQTLGLPVIKCYDSRDYISDNKTVERIIKKIGRNNPFVVKQVENNIKLFEQDNWEQFNWAFERMDFYYDNMVRHIGALGLLP